MAHTGQQRYAKLHMHARAAGHGCENFLFKPPGARVHVSHLNNVAVTLVLTIAR
jgi:hypothetical protein